MSSWAPGSMFSPGWVNYANMPENSFIVSPSVFVETPTGQVGTSHDTSFGELGPTHVALSDSVSGTPLYSQQQEQQEEDLYFSRNAVISTQERENLEDPMNTLATVSEARVKFTGIPEQELSMNVAREKRSYEDSTSIATKSATSSQMNDRHQNEQCSLSNIKSKNATRGTVKKPRPRGTASGHKKDMDSNLSGASGAKLEPRQMNAEYLRNSSTVVSPFYISAAPVMIFPSSDINSRKNTTPSVSSFSGFVQEDAKSERTTYPTCSSFPQNMMQNYYTIPSNGTMPAASSFFPLPREYSQRQWQQRSNESTSGKCRTQSSSSVVEEKASQRRERRKFARAQARAAASHICKTSSQGGEKNRTRAPSNDGNRKCSSPEVSLSMGYSPPEEFSGTSSRPEEGMAEDKEALDPKVIRAIRNREAALRSRQQAKARLKTLETENAEFRQYVSKLEKENAQLRLELEQLKQYLERRNISLGNLEMVAKTTE